VLIEPGDRDREADPLSLVAARLGTQWPANRTFSPRDRPPEVLEACLLLQRKRIRPTGQFQPTFVQTHRRDLRRVDDSIVDYRLQRSQPTKQGH
jgi:hypothetical protein